MIASAVALLDRDLFLEKCPRVESAVRREINDANGRDDNDIHFDRVFCTLDSHLGGKYVCKAERHSCISSGLP